MKQLPGIIQYYGKTRESQIVMSSNTNVIALIPKIYHSSVQSTDSYTMYKSNSVKEHFHL